MSLWNLVIHQLNAASTHKRERTNEEKLADEILASIVAGNRTAKSISTFTGYSLSTVSKYLRIIESNGNISLHRTIRNGPFHIRVVKID